MSSNPGKSSDWEARLDAAVAEYLACEDTGSTPDRTEFLARYPDHAKELAGFLEDQAHFRRIVSPFTNSEKTTTTSCPQCQCFLDTVDSGTTCASCGWRATLGPSVEDPFPITHRLGRIKLTAVIGRGGFGTVYKGWDAEMHRTVAIKVLRKDPNKTRAQSNLERFLREAKVTAQLDHPGIVRVYDVGQEKGTPYIVSELIEGRTLDSRIQTNRLTPKHAAKLMAQVADALHHAHQKGVVHRDVKPSNILMRDSDVPLITDFGLAFWDSGDASLTEDQQVLGTLRYMSPEQARGDTRRVDHRTDVYSLGVILYALLTGELPFTAKNRVILSYQVDYEEPRPPRALNVRVPRDLETICLKCLRKEPPSRYDTAADLADDLQRFLDGKPVLARPVGNFERLVLWAKRNRTLAAVGAMAAILLLATTVISMAWAVHADDQAKVIQKLLDESRLKTAMSVIDRALADADRGDVASGILRMAQSLELAPDHSTDFKWMSRTNLTAWRGQLLALTDCQEPPPGQIHCFTPDGRSVWFVDSDLKTVRRWNLVAERVEGPELKHTKPVSAMSVSPDGRRVATGCAGKNEPVRLWDAKTGDAVSLGELRGETQGLNFLSDGQGLVVAMVTPEDPKTNKTLQTVYRVWDTATGQPLGKDFSHPGRVSVAAICPDGKSVFVADRLGKTIRSYDFASGRAVDWTIRLPVPVTAIAVSADGRYVFTASEDRIARLHQTGFDHPRAVFRHRRPVSTVAFGADGRSLMTVSPGDAVRVWEGTDRLELLPTEQHTAKVRALAVSPDGKKMASGDDSRAVRICDVTDGKLKLVKSLPKHASPIASVTFSPDGGQLATSTHQNKGALLWSLTDDGGQDPIELKHPAIVHRVAFSPNGRRVATAGYNREVWLWTETGEFVAGPLIHGGAVRGAVFSPDGRTLLTCSEDGAARRWDAITGESQSDPLWHSSGVPVHAVAYSPDGRMIVTAGDDGAVRRWNAATGALIGFPVGHEYHVRQAVFSPDGKVIMTGSRDYTAKLWDATTGVILGPPLRHSAPVRAVAVDPTNLWAVSASEDGSARFWGVQTCRAIGPPLRHDAGVYRAVIEPKGRWAVTAGMDSTVRVWPAPVAISGDPDRITLWSQVHVGAVLDEAGNMQVLDPAAWRARRNQLKLLGDVPLP